MATFGNTNIEVNSYVSDNDVSGTQYDLSETGIVQSITAYVSCTFSSDITTNAKCAIYDSSNNFIAETLPLKISTTNWYTFPFLNYVTLTPGTYWLVAYGAIDTDQFILYGASDSSVVSCRQLDVGFPDFPNPLVPGTDNDRRYSIYANYTTLAVAWLTA